MADAAVASQPKQDVLFGRSGLSEREAVALDVFPCLLDVAEAMLLSGADVHFVEEKLADIGRAYGAYKMNVFVITSSIIATMTLPNGYEHTLTRRVIGEASIDFDKVERLATLCTEAGIENYTYKERAPQEHSDAHRPHMVIALGRHPLRRRFRPLLRRLVP